MWRARWDHVCYHQQHFGVKLPMPFKPLVFIIDRQSLQLVITLLVFWLFNYMKKVKKNIKNQIQVMGLGLVACMWLITMLLWAERTKEVKRKEALTKCTKSLAAIARMSAHDTTPGHLLSTKALALLMVSNPSTLKSLLSWAFLSANILLPGFDDINIDPSHPLIHQY